MKLHKLDELIQAVCPIDGIDSNGVINFKQEATPEQKVAAQAVMDANLVDLGIDSPAEVLRQQLAALDSANPITQRNLRELTLAVGQLIELVTQQPAAANRGVQAVLAIEAAAQPLRDELKAIEKGAV